MASLPTLDQDQEDAAHTEPGDGVTQPSTASRRTVLAAIAAGVFATACETEFALPAGSTTTSPGASTVGPVTTASPAVLPPPPAVPTTAPGLTTTTPSTSAAPPTTAPPTTGAAGSQSTVPATTTSTVPTNQGGGSAIKPAGVTLPGAQYSDQEVFHIANRLTFGITPALRQEIAANPDAFIEDQLSKNVPDPELEQKLSVLPAISRNSPDVKSKPPNYADKHVLAELTHVTFIRAVRSEHQLYEMMQQVWMDHFNVSGLYRRDIMSRVHYQEKHIRPHVMGKFRDLLHSTARSWAMLTYLNNDVSNANSAKGVNENYARELLELHTLGIHPDGSQVYTEEDMRAVALVLSGWSQRHGKFFWEPSRAYAGDVSILGGQWNSKGLAGANRVRNLLDFLANHESTARYIAYKLARRFISDNPPQSIIDSTAKVFRENDTDLVPALRHLFNSEEFRSSTGQKFRRPIEFTAAVLRYLNIVPSVAFQNPTGATLRTALERQYHVPWHWDQPDGFPDHAAAWLNTQAMMMRWTLAAKFANEIEALSGKVVPELRPDYSPLLARASTADELISTVADDTGIGPLSVEVRAEIADVAGLQPNSPTAGLPREVVARMVSPILSHPNFQIR